MAMHRFEFKSDEDFEDARLSLHLATLSVQGVYGDARTLLESKAATHPAERALSVDGSGAVGVALVRAFTRLLIEEFGPEGFEVMAIPTVAAPSAEVLTPALEMH